MPRNLRVEVFYEKNLSREQYPNRKIHGLQNFNHINKFLKTVSYPIVVKADGLASGKGVLICRTKNEVLNFSKKFLGANFKAQQN